MQTGDVKTDYVVLRPILLRPISTKARFYLGQIFVFFQISAILWGCVVVLSCWVCCCVVAKTLLNPKP